MTPLRQTLARVLAKVALPTLALCLSASSACRYALGPGEELPFHTLHLRMARNDSLAPQTGPLLTRALREEIIRQGRLRLVNSAEDADVVLTIRLTDYERTPEAFRSDDTALAAGFLMGLHAEATLQGTGGRTFFKDRSFRARASTLRETLTVSPASRQPLMAASRELARKIAFTVSHSPS